MQIFNNLLRRQIGTRWPTVEYISGKREVLFAALGGYENEEIALNTGMILREMLRHEPLCKILLYSEQYVTCARPLISLLVDTGLPIRFYNYPNYIESTTFGISTDAYTSLKETLTRHKPMVAEYLDKNYDRFFNSFTTLILSSNYVTKRQSLKLLGEILLDRANFSVMTRYIANDANLKMMMNLLRDKSKNIQFEAFHVFKVFVANPKKPPQIEAILRRNKEKLLVFLKSFHNDKDGEFLLFSRHPIDELTSFLDEQFTVRSLFSDLFFTRFLTSGVWAGTFRTRSNSLLFRSRAFDRTTRLGYSCPPPRYTFLSRRLHPHLNPQHVIDSQLSDSLFTRI